MLRDRDAAADCVQDVFCAAADRLHQLRDADKLRPWLYAIARNECLRVIRARGRERVVDEMPEVESADAGPETMAARSELASLVAEAAGGLSDRDREVLELAYRHGLDGPELAEALGVSTQCEEDGTAAEGDHRTLAGRAAGVAPGAKQPGRMSGPERDPGRLGRAVHRADTAPYIDQTAASDDYATAADHQAHQADGPPAADRNQAAGHDSGPDLLTAEGGLDALIWTPRPGSNPTSDYPSAADAKRPN